jgi:O-methyltransferase
MTRPEMNVIDHKEDGNHGADQPVLKREKRPRDPAQWIHRPMEKYRKGNRALAHRPDPAFFALADPVVQSGRTLLGYDRLYVFWQAIRNVCDLSGAVAEIGSYRGGSAYFIAAAFRAIAAGEPDIHIFDTFEGHPSNTITDEDPFHTPGRFGDTSYEEVKSYLSAFARLQVHKSEVSASLPHLPEQRYRLVHIDTDLYRPTLDCLAYFGSRLTSGGVVIVDDYAASKCPGVPKAVAEYLERTDGFHAWDMRTEQLMLVKR